MIQVLALAFLRLQASYSDIPGTPVPSSVSAGLGCARAPPLALVLAVLRELKVIGVLSGLGSSPRTRSSRPLASRKDRTSSAQIR